MADRITLQQILEAYDNDRMTKQDFLDALEKVNKKLDERMDIDKADLEAAAKAIAEAFDTLRTEIAQERTNNIQTIETTGTTTTERLDAKLRDLEALVAARLAEIKNGEPGPEGPMGMQGPAGSPDTAEDIRNKLELLEGDDRLSIEAIANLREELDELKKQSTSTTVIHTSGGSGGGRIVKVYDLSSSLDGSTTTFALPAFWRVLTVDLSSFPNALRPTVDYTTDASAMTITFTSEIDASTSLAAGQTCIITYSE